MLVFHRHQLKNEQKLKVARSLLRVSWSLTFSTISDLVNALRPSTQTGLYTVDELELFCQVFESHFFDKFETKFSAFTTFISWKMWTKV